MRNRILVMATAGLLIGVAGCGDSPSTIFHDAVVIRNEAADLMRQAYDDDSAERILKGKMERLKNRWKRFKDGRAKEVFGHIEGNKAKKAAARAFLTYLDEYLETEIRFQEEKSRLLALQKQSKDSSSGGQKLANLASAMNQFNMIDIWGENPFVGRGGNMMMPGGMPGGGMPPGGGGMPPGGGGMPPGGGGMPPGGGPGPPGGGPGPPGI